MTISLGRRSPGASSGLPGSHYGSGNPPGPRGRNLEGPMPPYLALLQVGFAEPDRSPDLLVSSYLTVSPLPRGSLPVAVYFLWHFPFPDEPGGGRYPPPPPAESGLSSGVPVQNGPPAVTPPATTSTILIRGRDDATPFLRNALQHVMTLTPGGDDRARTVASRFSTRSGVNPIPFNVGSAIWS